jgi:hypothetical protein
MIAAPQRTRRAGSEPYSAHASRCKLVSNRVIQTYGDAAFGHHELRRCFQRVIQTYGDAAFGHHELRRCFQRVIQTYGDAAFGHHALAGQ